MIKLRVQISISTCNRILIYISVRIRMTTAALEPIRVTHVAKEEEVEIIWSIDHWSADEKNSLLYYELTLQSVPMANQRRRRRNADSTCTEGRFY